MREKILLAHGPSRRSLHRLDTWLYCRRSFILRYGLKGALLPGVPKSAQATSGPLVRGTLIHAAQAQYWSRVWALQNGHDPEAYFDPLTAIDLVVARERENWGDYAVAEYRPVVETMKQWLARFPEEATAAGPDRVLHVEEVFEFRIKGPRTGREWDYTQRIDVAFGSTVTGRVRIRDWKSSSELRKTTHPRYAPSLQFLAFQHWGPQRWQSQWGGAECAVLEVEHPYRVDTRPIEPAPALVQMFPAICEKAELEIEAAVQEAAELEAKGLDPLWAFEPAANERVCTTSYGPCDVWDACLWGPGAAQGGRTNPALVQLGEWREDCAQKG